MIKELDIKNFQCWEEVLFTFHPGVNAVIGLSDKGKSSFIRALLWPITNKPAGETVMSHWLGRGEETTVLLTTEDVKVSRLRSKSKNLYYLNGSERASFRQAPPDDIQQALNFSDLNIQRQAESFFLVNFTAGEVARYLNRIVNLEEIDGSLLHAGREVRRHRKLAEGTQQQIEELDQKMEVLTWVTEAASKHSKLEAESRALRQRENKLTQLDTLLYRLSQAEEELVKYDHVGEMREKLDAWAQLHEEIEDRTMPMIRLGSLLNEIQIREKRIASYVKVPEMREKLDWYSEMAAEIAEAEKRVNSLGSLLDDISKTQEDIDEKAAYLQSLEDQFNEAFPDVCPLCDNVCPSCGEEIKG